MVLVQSSAATALNDGEWQYVTDPKWKKAENIGVSLESDGDRIFVLRRSSSSSFSIVEVKRNGEDLSEFKLDGVKSAHSVHYHGSEEKPASLWVTDKGSGALVEYTLDGKIIKTITEVKYNDKTLTFDRVTSLAWDSDGHMFLADGDRDGKYNRVIKLKLKGRDEKQEYVAVDIWGKEEPGQGEKEFNLPHALVVDEYDNVWIADALNHRIQVIGHSGNFIAQKDFKDFITDMDYKVSFGVYGIDICKTAQVSLWNFVFWWFERIAIRQHRSWFTVEFGHGIRYDVV